MEITKDYVATVDSKRRITIRGSEYKYYDVKEYEDGSLRLEPRKLVSVDKNKDINVVK